MSMKFSPDGRYLVVSTKLRLLLLGLEKDNNSFSVCSWMELDRVEGLTAIFSVDFILVNKNNDEGEEIDKVVIWKVEDRSASITDSDGVEKPYNSDIDLESTPIIDGRAVEKKNRRCGISRKELTANMWNETIQSIKYI